MARSSDAFSPCDAVSHLPASLSPNEGFSFPQQIFIHNPCLRFSICSLILFLSLLSLAVRQERDTSTFFPFTIYWHYLTASINAYKHSVNFCRQAQPKVWIQPNYVSHSRLSWLCHILISHVLESFEGCCVKVAYIFKKKKQPQKCTGLH